jgi:hypothetical protein
VVAALLQSSWIVVALEASVVAKTSPAWSAMQTGSAAKQSEWFAGLQAALKAARAGNYKDALAIAQRADRLPIVPPDMAVQVHDAIVGYAIQAKDYETAAAMNDRMLMANEGYPYDVLETCVLVAMLQNNIARARECAGLFDAQQQKQGK